MKNTWLALVVLCCFFSCKSKTGQNVSDSVVNNGKDPSNPIADSKKAVTTSGILAEKFRPFIQGTWVKSDYIDAILKTRSPYASRAELGDVADILIDAHGALNDSLAVGYSLNNHEGGNFTILFQQGHLSTSLKITLPDYDHKSNFYELGYTIEDADTTLVLYHMSKNNTIIGSTKYTRVNSSAISDDAASGIELITNQKLISGTYITTDIGGHRSYIEFDNAGNVYNFLAFKKYDVNTDFVAGPANNIDQIYFDVYTKKQKEYTYQLLADTLQLFEINYDADSMVQSRGKLRYKLVRKK